MWRNLLIKFGIATKITPPAAGPKPSASRQYLLSPKQITHLFSDLQLKQQLISLQFSDDSESVRHEVEIIHVEPQKRHFLIDLSSVPDTEIKCSGSAINLTLPYRNATLSFSSSIQSKVQWESKFCYLARLPEYLLSSEMRCYARVRLNPMHGASVSIFIDQNDHLRSSIENICENGFRISLQQKFNLKPNDLVSAQIELPEFGKLRLKAIIRDYSDTQNKTELGFEILEMSEAEAQLLRRYVMKCTATRAT